MVAAATGFEGHTDATVLILHIRRKRVQVDRVGRTVVRYTAFKRLSCGALDVTIIGGDHLTGAVAAVTSTLLRLGTADINRAIKRIAPRDRATPRGRGAFLG